MRLLAPFDAQEESDQQFLPCAYTLKGLGPLHPQQRPQQRRRIGLLGQVLSEDPHQLVTRNEQGETYKDRQALGTSPAPAALLLAAVATRKRREILAARREERADLQFEQRPHDAEAAD